MCRARPVHQKKINVAVQVVFTILESVWAVLSIASEHTATWEVESALVLYERVFERWPRNVHTCCQCNTVLHER